MGADDVNTRAMRGESVDPFRDSVPIASGPSLAKTSPASHEKRLGERGAGEDENSRDDVTTIPQLAPVMATIGVAEIFEPLPALPWLVRELQLAPGAPAVVAGYGFSGKTLLAQELAICVASEKRLFDNFTVRKGRSLHIDLEQGRRVTSERYQRLARAKNIDPRDLGDRLRLAVLPPFSLDASGAEGLYHRAIDGFDFVAIDSLRAACPSADENASDIRKHLDILTRISEKTNATILFIHHSRKPSAESAGAGMMDRMMMRGSGAIFDACSSVFIMGGEKGDPSRVSHQKCRHYGTTIDDFGFWVKDVPGNGNPRDGLKLEHLRAEQLAAFFRERESRKAEASAKKNGKTTTERHPHGDI